MLRIERVFFQGAGTFQARLVARNSIRNRAGAHSCKQRAGLYESHQHTYSAQVESVLGNCEHHTVRTHDAHFCRINEQV